MSQASPSVSTTASPFALPSPFACRWKADGPGSARVHLVGELDLATLPLFRETLREAQLSANAVSIDLQALEFIDCAALGVIADADAVAGQTGNKLILLRGSGQVDRILALTGVLDRLEVLDLHLDTAPSDEGQPPPV